MTTDELDALAPGTVLFIPGDLDVTKWLFAGRVPNRNFYTLLHPPDPDGVLVNKRPFYIDCMELTTAKLDEQGAWLAVLDNLEERKRWIYKVKIIQ